MPKDLKKWKKNSSSYSVEDRWFKLRADSYTTPEGHVIEPYYILEFPDWANCFVIDDSQDVVMVRHYRPGADTYIPELISGELEAHDGTPEEGIKRELEEEAGYVGGTIQQIGVSYPNPGRQDNKVFSFIAFGGSCANEQKLEKGESLQVMKVPFKDLAAMLQNNDAGVVYQSMHIATIYFALNFIKHSDAPEMRALKQYL